MLAADGVDTSALCLASASASGSITLGNTTATTGASDLQFGLLNDRGTFSIIAPSGGAVLAAPVQIPGGLLGLMCPSNIPLVSEICAGLVDGDLNAVTGTLEPAGDPSEFNLAAGLSAGVPILTLPVKIHLRNPFLGSNCYVGSNSDPIVLHPANLSVPQGSIVAFDQDGTLDPDGDMGYVKVTGTGQRDDSFAVPGANGCGLAGLLDLAVNLKVGLPSPAGNNSLVLNAPTTYLGGFLSPAAFAPTEGQQLADRWHAAVVG
ncbi:hypothetical protein [Actinophytocola sp.]|uniref:hypothetical protein n=1 Tax=Actinophytocola sp. TaxID=1872138 RepID=UPI0025C43A5F|nr:hypothetical protein [Actinophytocola sp.]